MKKKPSTVKSHYVPEFYLKQFAIENPKQGFMVKVFDAKAGRILNKSYSTAQICRDKFFYAVVPGVVDKVSEVFEDTFGKIETVFSKALPGIIERAVAQELDNKDRYHLAHFMTVQWMRTPSKRDQLQKIYSDFMKWKDSVRASLPGFRDLVRSTAEDIGEEVSDENVEEVKRFIQSGEYNYRQDNSPHLNFIDEEKVNVFVNCLQANRWRIYLSKEPYNFITSDNPVVEWCPPRPELFPPTFMDRSHIVALTPKILIEAAPPGGKNAEQLPLDRFYYHTDTDMGAWAFTFNKLIANDAHQFAYAPRTSEFERLLKAI